MIDLDMNDSEFQKQLFDLEKPDLQNVVNTLRKIRKLSWEQLQQHSGLNWEWIERKGYYTFRASSKIRIAALRDNNTLHLLEIFPDHDGAYERR
jgi:hypothetical protein